MSFDFFYEALGEGVQEVDVSTLCVEAEVYEILGRRDVAVDESESVGTVICNCMNVNLFFFLLPIITGIAGKRTKKIEKSGEIYYTLD